MRINDAWQRRSVHSRNFLQYTKGFIRPAEVRLHPLVLVRCRQLLAEDLDGADDHGWLAGLVLTAGKFGKLCFGLLQDGDLRV
jgi:hypothetical protein